MAYGIVRIDKVRSCYVGHLESVQFDGTVTTTIFPQNKIENGMICNVGTLLTGEREIKEMVVPATATLATAPVYLIAVPEINYTQTKKTDASLQNFATSTDEPVRAYSLEQGDIFSVSQDMITALANNTPVVGNYVVAANGVLKLKEAATLAGTEKFAGKIIEKQTLGTTTYVGGSGAIARPITFYAIEVISN